jgi:DNA-binding SARP family transcriptional activator
MEFQVLGAVGIRREGRGDALAGRLRRVLLAVLLSRANQPVAVDVLTDALWGEAPDEKVGQRLHLHVHRLRQALGGGEAERLSFGPEGYRLRVAAGELDADRFESQVGRAVEAVEREPGEAVASLREALGLWRGTPFAGMDVPVLADWAHRLAERRLVAVETLFQGELACGRDAAIVSELAEAVREHPLRERLHGLLMIALYRAGRQADALAAYRAARDTLVEELGLEPGPELRELERRILAGEPVEAAEPERTSSGAPAPAQLPLNVRAFVGREAELAELDGLLSAPTPVVISAVAGTAGVGKTALAVRWAHRVREQFPDGQLYVDLRGYGPDQPVPPDDALAGFLRALGLEGAAVPQDLAERAARFRTLLDGRRMLIVLDNARTVEQVRPLLPGSSTCFTLVTSRDALAGLVAREGAHRIALDRLRLEEARGLLGGLLGERAASEPGAVDALVERCARLPLALRIVAELVRAQPARGVAELAGELADRQGALDLLDIDGDPHTAVRAVFSWSYQQLDPAVARVFRLLGLHPGHDTDAYAVAALAGSGLRDTRRALDVLLRAHLVDQTAGGRYQPHDLLRAYAAELATVTDSPTERGAALDRLLDYYLATASAAMDVVSPHDYAPRPKVPAPGGETPPLTSYDHAWRWLDAERANLLEATRHGGEPGYVISMSQTVWRYLDTGSYYDDGVTLQTRAMDAARTLGDPVAEAHARRVLAAVLNRIGDNREVVVGHLTWALAVYEQAGNRLLQAATLNVLAVVHSMKGELAEAEGYFERTLALTGEGESWYLHVAASLNHFRNLLSLGRVEEVARRFDPVLALCRDKGDGFIECNALTQAAKLCLLLGQGRVAEAFDHARRSLELAREGGYRAIEADSLCVLGTAYRQQGDGEQALRHHEEALALARAVGDTEVLAEALNALGTTHISAGRPAEALRCHCEALTVTQEGGHGEEQAHTHAGMAEAHAALGEHEQAREHWREAFAYYEALGMPQATDVRARLDGKRQ